MARIYRAYVVSGVINGEPRNLVLPQSELEITLDCCSPEIVYLVEGARYGWLFNSLIGGCGCKSQKELLESVRKRISNLRGRAVLDSLRDLVISENLKLFEGLVRSEGKVFYLSIP